MSSIARTAGYQSTLETPGQIAVVQDEDSGELVTIGFSGLCEEMTVGIWIAGCRGGLDDRKTPGGARSWTASTLPFGRLSSWLSSPPPGLG
jgi:hypothetical protein